MTVGDIQAEIRDALYIESALGLILPFQIPRSAEIIGS
jgi:hypothetical protein